MNCPDITTLEQAEATLPSSVLPIDGLRRGEDGTLTKDARNMIIDGLKSRGINITDPTIIKNLIDELMTLLCSVNKQYEFLLKELYIQVKSGRGISDVFLKNIHDKNIFMLDILTISRHITNIKSYDDSIPFIEGWQSGSSGTSPPDTSALSNKLLKDREMLASHSYEELRKHTVEVTMEKNKIVSNYLGIYGFLNLLAVGLIIYVAGTR